VPGERVSLMCGIAGVLEFREGRTVPGHLLEAMGKVIEHRGPDQGGVFQAGPVGLAARRLRIIDLSPAGSQPLADEDGTIQLVYHYLGYEFVPGPATMFQGIRKLPPGAILLAADGQVDVERYWELAFADAADDPATLERRVREACRDAVHAWMMSDVPDGVF